MLNQKVDAYNCPGKPKNQMGPNLNKLGDVCKTEESNQNWYEWKELVVVVKKKDLRRGQISLSIQPEAKPYAQVCPSKG